MAMEVYKNFTTARTQTEELVEQFMTLVESTERIVSSSLTFPGELEQRQQSYEALSCQWRTLPSTLEFSALLAAQDSCSEEYFLKNLLPNVNLGKTEESRLDRTVEVQGDSENRFHCHRLHCTRCDFKSFRFKSKASWKRHERSQHEKRLPPDREYVSIAVMGTTGAGKSSFIRALDSQRFDTMSKPRTGMREPFVCEGMFLILRLGIQISTTRLDNRDSIFLVDTPSAMDTGWTQSSSLFRELVENTIDNDIRITYNPHVLQQKLDRLLPVPRPSYGSRDRTFHLPSRQELHQKLKGPSSTIAWMYCCHGSMPHRRPLHADYKNERMRSRILRMRNSPLVHHMVRHRARSRNTGESWRPSLHQPG